MSGGQQLERQVPFAGNDAVEALANRVRLDVRDEASEELSVARRSDVRPDARRSRPTGSGATDEAPRCRFVVDILLPVVSRDHTLILPLLVASMLTLAFLPCAVAELLAGGTARQFLPCSQYHPCRSKKTRCVRTTPVSAFS